MRKKNSLKKIGIAQNAISIYGPTFWKTGEKNAIASKSQSLKLYRQHAGTFENSIVFHKRPGNRFVYNVFLFLVFLENPSDVTTF